MMEAVDDITIVDVRTPEVYPCEHFPNAINIPLDQVAQRVHEFKEMPQPTIAYCRSENRSGITVSVLKQNEFADAGKWWRFSTI